MPIEKPQKPTELIPRAFGGIKNKFSDDLQATGFEPNVPQTYNGDNLNYHLDATGKELDYVEKVVDFINQTPVKHIPFVNENNQLDYVDAGALVAQMELKADINLSNLTDIGKNNVVNFVMPNENTVSFTIGASFAEYIAPADGYFFATATYNGGAGYLVLSYGNTALAVGNSVIAYYTTAVGYGMRTFVPIAKGQSVFFGYQGVKDTSLKFCYAIGSESEAE